MERQVIAAEKLRRRSDETLRERVDDLHVGGYRVHAPPGRVCGQWPAGSDGANDRVCREIDNPHRVATGRIVAGHVGARVTRIDRESARGSIDRSRRDDLVGRGVDDHEERGPIGTAGDVDASSVVTDRQRTGTAPGRDRRYDGLRRSIDDDDGARMIVRESSIGTRDVDERCRVPEAGQDGAQRRREQRPDKFRTEHSSEAGDYWRPATASP